MNSAQSPATDSGEQGRPERKRRRLAAVAMEYLFVISLIIVVLIAVIEQFGLITRNSFKNSSDKMPVVQPDK